VLAEARDLQVVRDGRVLLALEHVAIPGPGPAMVEGPNGSGKSTLLAVLAGLQPPTRGIVEVFGERLWPAAERTRRATRRGIVLCDSEPLFFRGTVAANVAFCAGGADAPAALAAFGAAGLAARRPGTLSTGERRRADLARALIRRPRLLLLDEPTSHLDAEGARWVLDAIRRICAAGTGVVFSNHGDRDLAALAAFRLTLGKAS